MINARKRTKANWGKNIRGSIPQLSAFGGRAMVTLPSALVTTLFVFIPKGVQSHDFRDPDGVWVPGAPPGEIAGIGTVPMEQAGDDGGAAWGAMVGAAHSCRE